MAAATDGLDVLAFTDISALPGGVRTIVVTAREDVEIARQVHAAPIWVTGVKRAWSFRLPLAPNGNSQAGGAP